MPPLRTALSAAATARLGGGAGSPRRVTRIFCPSTRRAARFRRSRSARGGFPPAGARASATREPAGGDTARAEPPPRPRAPPTRHRSCGRFDRRGLPATTGTRPVDRRTEPAAAGAASRARRRSGLRPRTTRARPPGPRRPPRRRRRPGPHPARIRCHRATAPAPRCDRAARLLPTPRPAQDSVGHGSSHGQTTAGRGKEPGKRAEVLNLGEAHRRSPRNFAGRPRRRAGSQPHLLSPTTAQLCRGQRPASSRASTSSGIAS